MREITTIDGKVFTGRNAKFEDKGDYIEQINTFSSVKIYKNNIVTDKQDSSEAIALATTVAVAVVSGGTVVI